MLLRKGVYPYEHMDEWEKFNEKTSEKEECCSINFCNLNMDNITDTDHMHAKIVCKDLKVLKLWTGVTGSKVQKWYKRV